MVKIGVIGIVFYGFLALGMEVPSPLPLNAPLSPGLDFEDINQQLRAHVAGGGPAEKTVEIITSFYRLCIENRTYCNKQFYRQIAQLPVHQLQSSAQVACWLWKQQLKQKITSNLIIADEEINTFANVMSNCSIIMNFCQRIKGLAQ